jgi:hypothetical protein
MAQNHSASVAMKKSLVRRLPANCQHTAPEVDMTEKIAANRLEQRVRNSLQQVTFQKHC